MSEKKEKNLKRLFLNKFKDQIHEEAKKQVTEHVEKKIKGLEKMVRVIARMRDIIFLIACGLFISNIVFIWLWVVK